MPDTHLLALLTYPFDDDPERIRAAIEQNFLTLGYRTDEARFFALLAVRVRALDRFTQGTILQVGGAENALVGGELQRKAQQEPDENAGGTGV
jgi:hypothetical protein